MFFYAHVRISLPRMLNNIVWNMCRGLEKIENKDFIEEECLEEEVERIPRASMPHVCFPKIKAKERQRGLGVGYRYLCE